MKCAIYRGICKTGGFTKVKRRPVEGLKSATTCNAERSRHSTCDVPTFDRCKQSLSVLTALLLFGCTPEQNRIEQELATTEKQLAGLPHIKVDTLVPTLGYISGKRDSENSVEHITVTFPEPKPIDTVVLVPANSLNDQNEYTVNRFPVRFKIEAQTENGDIIRIADHTQSDFPCPGIAPTIFNSSDDRSVKDLTLTVTKLPLGFAEEYLFILNELLFFREKKTLRSMPPFPAKPNVAVY